MECVLVLAFIVFAVAVPLARMLFRKGPNHWRRLLRLDLAALLVITTGVAGAFAMVRGADLGSALCALTFILPMSLAFAWLGRYVLEDLAAGRRRHGKLPEVDLSYLQHSESSNVGDVPIQAEAVDDDRDEMKSA
jgi:hypothetical protein